MNKSETQKYVQVLQSENKVLKKQVEKLEECIEKLDDELARKGKDMRDTDDENIYLKNQLYRNECNFKKYEAKVKELKKQISDLQSELSVKENLMKIKNGLCREKSEADLKRHGIEAQRKMKEKIYQRKVSARAFQFDGDVNNFIFNPDTPQWAINAWKIEIIKKRYPNTVYIDHREHTDFVNKGDYIINENGHIFSLPKEDFEKLYEYKNG